MATTFPDIRTKLNKFVETKIRDPLTARYGKHDRRMIGDLTGFWHCHLRDDAVLIYSLSQRVMTLVYLAPHAEIEGKRLKMTARRLSQFA
jgi:mRNA-degrading endonuclease YafQ of YafQ-DinJ toxin-antitoxin module